MPDRHLKGHESTESIAEHARLLAEIPHSLGHAVGYDLQAAGDRLGPAEARRSGTMTRNRSARGQVGDPVEARRIRKERVEQTSGSPAPETCAAIRPPASVIRILVLPSSLNFSLT